MTRIVIRMATDDAALACFAAAALLAGVAVFIIAFRMWRAGCKPKPAPHAETALYPAEVRQAFDAAADETVQLRKYYTHPNDVRAEGRWVR